MILEQFQDGLTALGFTTGYAIGGEPAEIILWENETKQPTNAAIAKAAPQGAYLREIEAIKKQRQEAYMRESDPIFFESHRDPMVKEETWREKVAEIQARFPYPTKPEA